MITVFFSHIGICFTFICFTFGAGTGVRQILSPFLQTQRMSPGFCRCPHGDRTGNHGCCGPKNPRLSELDESTPSGFPPRARDSTTDFFETSSCSSSESMSIERVRSWKGKRRALSKEMATVSWDSYGPCSTLPRLKVRLYLAMHFLNPSGSNFYTHANR